MADVNLLKVERGRIKGSLTKLKNFSDNIPGDKTIEDIQTRMERLEEIQREFRVVDDKLVMNVVESEYSTFEDKYLETRAALRRHLSRLSTTERDSTSNDQLNVTISRIAEQQRALFDTFSVPAQSTDVKLPRVDIPAFSGDYKDWPSFKDLFLTSVDRKENMSAVHKLQYLKGLLKGEAAALVKHLTITEANYMEAWSKLIKRYDKKRQIVSAYIKSFMAQSPLSQPSTPCLRRLADTSDQIIRAIKVLGREASGRDPWIIHIMLGKTDPDTRKAWAEETAEQEFPSIDAFIEFLNKRCDALETFDAGVKRQPATNPIRNLHLDTSQKCMKCSQNHQLFKCQKYKNLDVATRRAFISKHSLCFNCLSSGHTAQKCKSKFRCHHCQQLHHSSLHNAKGPILNQPATTQELDPSTLHSQTANFTDEFTKSISDPCQSTPGRQPHINTYTLFNENQTKLTILPTAIINISDEYGTLHSCRALLDSGSQASFISEECVQRLQLRRNKARITVRGLSSSPMAVTRGMVSLTTISRFSSNHKLQVQAYILGKLSAPQPSRTFHIKALESLHKYNLADPQFNESRKIDIILGADQFNEILQDGRIDISPNLPVLQNTIFGYIIMGTLNINSATYTLNSLHVDITDIDATLRKFWEIEEIPMESTKYTQEEDFCESLFASTHLVDPATNRYMVRLPFREETPDLGTSFQIARSRFNFLEKRLQRDSQLHRAYSDFLDEYRTLQHLEPIPPSALVFNREHAYLPHHPVIKLSSTTTKVRVVFNGSQPTSTGQSLNQKLLIGPKVQRDLLPILLSFRSFKIAIVADIEKMYRQILVHREDRNYQRILWRSELTEPVKHFWLNTVTYGTSAAPFLATRSLKQLTIEFKGQYPLAEAALRDNFYVDDLLGGADDEDNALLMHSQLTTLLQLRGFTLRKWASNSKAFLQAISASEHCTNSLQIEDNPESLKVLGLRWIPDIDCFTFEVTLPKNVAATKRTILSESSRVFDPMGLIAPVTIKFKILLQHLWLKHYDWDEICIEHAGSWERMRKDLAHLQQLRIPRWIHSSMSSPELHGFSDASEAAYAAVIYCRVTSQNDMARVNLVAAKTRVSPIKQLSIPKLELCGATLLAKLMKFVSSTLNIPAQRCFGWTDSTVVLHWLSSPPRKWKCFVGNRTSIIQSVLPRNQWYHVTSAENPADQASRGVLAIDLINSELWWQGPTWLKTQWNNGSRSNAATETDAEAAANVEKRERYIDAFHLRIDNDILLSLFNDRSSLTHILRVLGRCFQFIRHCKLPKNSEKNPWLTSEDLRFANRGCVLWAQGEVFRKEIQALEAKQQLSPSSSLWKLAPFLDENHILRLGGRIEHASCHYDAKHPIILPRDHIFVKRLISQLHETHLHAGTSLLLNIIRQKFWILGCRTLIKAHINKCLTCVRHRAATSQQMMACLPKHRVGTYRPFENLGVDYAGPFTLLLRRGRGARSIKGYIVVFVCFSTRAMHLELAGDMTSDTFVACLKRFVSRRGIPHTIYSDNGTNFVGAARHLNEIENLVRSFYKESSFSHFVSSREISWNFIPPSAPHFGGLWEAGVKCVKTHLRKVIGATKLTYEEMYTLLVQIEGLLNSRPLTPVTDDVSSLDALTPGHFIIGQPLTSLPEMPVSSRATSLQGRWRLLLQMHQHFWKRWQHEYLSSLQQRPKWFKVEPNLSIGDLVIIKEINLPPSRWVTGRIVKTYPGSDGLVRVCDVRTAQGVFKRPTAKLCKLPCHNS